jgi:hypothetical protein
MIISLKARFAIPCTLCGRRIVPHDTVAWNICREEFYHERCALAQRDGVHVPFTYRFSVANARFREYLAAHAEIALPKCHNCAAPAHAVCVTRRNKRVYVCNFCAFGKYRNARFVYDFGRRYGGA